MHGMPRRPQPASQSSIGKLTWTLSGRALLYCMAGNIKHAGNDVVSGDRYILVGFYNADGRDRAGEEAHFSKRALEQARRSRRASRPMTVKSAAGGDDAPHRRTPCRVSYLTLTRP